MALKLALFDCDGTLADSQHAIVAAMRPAFARCGLAAPDEGAVRRSIGLSLPRLIATLTPGADPALQSRLVDAYRDEYFSQRTHADSVPEPLFTGIPAVLTALASGGWQLGIATGKSQRGLLRLLDAHGITDLFVTLQTADFHPSKPDPSMARAAMAQASVSASHCVVIGDTSFDMAMAKSAGAHAVGVAWGGHGTSELLAAGAAEVVPHTEQLVTAINCRLETMQ